MREDTRAWISKAKIDIASAKVLYNNGLFDTCCYHCQQSSEKYLKALMCELGQPIPKIHDLEKLGRLISSAGVDFNDAVLEDCMSLTGIDTLVRYPGYDASEEDAGNAVSSSSNIESFVLKYLGVTS